MKRAAAGMALLATVLMVGTVAMGEAPGTTDWWRDPGATDPSRGLQELAASLNARERALERREAAHQQKEKDLALAEQRLEQRLAELEKLRTDMSELLEGMDEDREARIVALVKAVENMRAKQAAALLQQTEPELAAAVLDRMGRMKAGRAMAAMNPRTAAGLAALLTRPVELD